MSLRTLPLLIINVGGEMLYILDQRLRAQDEHDDKPQRGAWTEDDRKRVLNDIVATMFSKTFLEEILKPQDVFSHQTLRTVLTRIAHASIMRLNPASMDRLYDLMTMAFKYQIVLCPHPRDLLLITFNHTDSIKDLVKDSPNLVNLINEAQRQFIEVYTPLSDSEFQLIRHTLLVFLQDMQIRVSIFLKQNIQKPDGHFVLPTSGQVPYGFQVPGSIRWFNPKGREVKRTLFPSGSNYTRAPHEASFDLSGDRVTRLGTNMYSEALPDSHPSDNSTSTRKQKQVESAPNPLATEELNLLAKLMGGMEVQKLSNVDTGFKVNLLALQQEDEGICVLGGAEQQSATVINIQAIQDQLVSTELARIAEEFTEDGSQTEESWNKGDDLLAMMDDIIINQQKYKDVGYYVSMNVSLEGASVTFSAFFHPKNGGDVALRRTLLRKMSVEVTHSLRERTIAENSLVVLLQGLHGHVTSVDLRDESTARGRVMNVDAFMNIRLEEVLYRDRRGRVSRMDDLFVTGRNVRYVHIPDHLNITETIQTQLAKIHRVRNFGGGDGRKEYSKKK